MLEFDDIQHILLTRVPALTGRYEFLSFRNAAGGRAWLSAILTKVPSAAEVRASTDKDNRWVSVAFTLNGLRALGLGEDALATFPEEFRQGMVARSEMLGDTGANHPDNWVGGLAGSDLHAIVILFARDATERSRCQVEHANLVARCEGVEVLSTLDLEATPPFDCAHDHFGYRDRLSEPVMEGTGEVPTPGSGGRSNPANSSSATRTKMDHPPICRNLKFCPGTAATWLIAACKSMSASSASSCARTARPRRTGTDRSKADGSLAQWRTVGAGA